MIIDDGKMWLYFVSLCCMLLWCQGSTNKDNYIAGSLFERYFIDTYGDGNSIGPTQLADLMNKLQEPCQAPSHQTPYTGAQNVLSQNFTCENISNPSRQACLSTQCLGPEDLIALQSASGSTVNVTSFPFLCPAILYQLNNPACFSNGTSEEPRGSSPSAKEVWGYGLLAVTIINMCSLFGLIFYPIMRKSYYTKFLMFMESLGIGTLTANALLVLIPETFALEHSDLADIYIWQSLTVLGGVYLFFLVERFLGAIKTSRKSKKDRKHPVTLISLSNGDTASSDRKIKYISEICIGQEDIIKNNNSAIEKVSNSSDAPKSTTSGDNAQIAVPPVGGHSHGDGDIRSVAWMIVFGDALHNFVDGLSIGAAFTNRILLGVSVSLAIICEELPHELGDFAILLSAGMSLKKALLSNFLSACTCYIGFAIGVLVGELTTGTTWIFALAAGMFLYIALVDMLPEVNREAELEVESTGRLLPTFLIQNCGLLAGFAIILLLAQFGGNIDVTTVTQAEI